MKTNEISISIKDGNLPENCSIFIPADEKLPKQLCIDGSFYEIPDDDEMRLAVDRRQMEGEAASLANWEMKLARFNVYSHAYGSENAKWMQARFAFKDRYGKSDTQVYNEMIKRISQ